MSTEVIENCDSEIVYGTQSALSIVKEELDLIECFACRGFGKLSRRQLLKDLGGKEILNLLSMNETQFFKKLEESAPKLIREIKDTLEKKNQSELQVYKENFTNMLNEREKTIQSRYEFELRKAMEEIAKLKVSLDGEMKARQVLEVKTKSVSSLKGNGGERDFKDWISQFAQFEVSDKLQKTGDYLVKIKKYLPNGTLQVSENTALLVDVKTDLKIDDPDIEKLFRDAKFRQIQYAYLIVKNKDGQFRGEDFKRRLVEKDGILLFKGDRTNFLEDCSFLEHLISARTKIEGTDYTDRSERFHKLIMENMAELDEFRNYAANIIREAEKVNKSVDIKKSAIIGQIAKIIGGAI